MERKRRLLAQAVSAQLARGLFINGGFRPIIRHYVHPTVSGLDNLAEVSPPFLMAPNHSSHMDTPLLLMSLPKDVRRRTLVAAASDYFFTSRMLGTFVSVAMGAVPMERRAGGRQGMTSVRQILEQKWCLVMYPEGSRTPDGRLYKGRTGIARLAMETSVPVVPVGIVGTYHSMPGGRSWPIPGRVEVKFGKPLTFERYRLNGASQVVLRAITDQIMYDIMALTGLTYVDEYVTKAKARASSVRLEALPSIPPNDEDSAPSADVQRTAPDEDQYQDDIDYPRDVSSG
jgi:1-acyl-sn-glycerol-3-phosphate acyltransferase